MSESKRLPELVERMLYRDFVLALLYLKPGNPLIHEEAFAYGLRKAAEEYPQLREKGFFQRQSSEGSCGSTHTTLDSILDGLRFCFIADTPSYQYVRLTILGKARVQEGFPEEYGSRVLNELRPFAQEVWKVARGHQSMYNQQELYT